MRPTMAVMSMMPGRSTIALLTILSVASIMMKMTMVQTMKMFMSAPISSILWYPNDTFSSISFFERYRKTKEKTKPSRSLTKWIASEMMAIDLAIVPPTT